MRSATTPPTNEKSRIGTWARNESRPRRNGRFRDFENQPALRDHLHPSADAGKKSAAPEQAEVSVLKCFENPCEQCAL